MAKRPNIYKSPYKSERKGVYYGEVFSHHSGGPVLVYKIVNADGAKAYNGMVPWQIQEGNGKWLAKLDFRAGGLPNYDVPGWFAAETLDDIQAMLTKLESDLA